MNAIPLRTPVGREGLAVIASIAVALASLEFSPAVGSVALACAAGALVAWIAWQDARTFSISDAALVALLLLALSSRLLGARISGEPLFATFIRIAVDAAVPSGALWLFREIHFRRKGYDGLGFGDVKLAAVGGVLVGAVDFAWALCAASLIGLVILGLGRGLGHAIGRSDRFALGAALAPALWLIWLAEQAPKLLALVDA